MNPKWNIAAKRQYEAWIEEKKAIIATNPVVRESDEQRQANIKKAMADFSYFARRYFSHLAKAPMGYFHKRDTDMVIANPDFFGVMEYPREHAKSIIYDVILPLHLKARGELTGMMLASANEKKAATLLGDVQAELMFNQQYIADFGEQYSIGNWQDGYFVTSDGIGFWAFGRGQSPRGTRKSDRRPNYGIIDDIDDAVLVRNESRVDETCDWILGDFYGAMPNKASRLIIVGNRIHRKSTLAKMVGDIEPGDPKRQGLYHSKVFALENPKTRKKDLTEKGVPAWKENFTRKEILTKMQRQGSRIGLREFFHEHITVGKIFKEEHLPWVKAESLQSYDKLITYNDPSYKSSQTSDCKAIVLIGKKGRFYDVIDCFVAQCTTGTMVKAHYDIAERVPEKVACRHYMEANFIQDLMLEEYWREGERRGKTMRIRGDKRKKPDKEARIENLTPFTEQGFIRFNSELRQLPSMQLLREHFLGFPDHEHDDGPDAVEGAIYLLNQRSGEAKKAKGGRMLYGKSNNSRNQGGRSGA